jgi:hypothetical protein
LQQLILERRPVDPAVLSGYIKASLDVSILKAILLEKIAKA